MVDHRVTTPLVLSRFLAGFVANRDRTNDDATVRAVMSAAAELRKDTPHPWEDADVTTRTVQALSARGDTAGATLLVAAVARTSPASAEPEALETETRPPRLRAPLLVPYLLPLVLAPAGILGIVGGLFLVRLIRQGWRVMPSLSWTDEKAWSAITQLKFDVRRGRARSSSQLRGLVMLGVLLGLIVGSALAVGAYSVVADLWPGAAESAGVLLAILLVVGGPVLGGLLGSWCLRIRDVRAIRGSYVKQDRERLAAAGTCRCWETARLSGSFAAAYATAHLRVSTEQPFHGQLAGRSVSSAECPLSGVRWLATTTWSGRTALLLRGTPRTAPTSTPAVQTGTGGYL